MIEVKVTNNRMNIKGHAGAGEHGRDIVCAAVSILWDCVVEKMHKENICFSYIEDSGMCELVICETNTIKRILAEHILDTAVCGLVGLYEEYPENLSLKKY